MCMIDIIQIWILFRSNPHSKKIDIKKIQDNVYNKGNGISNAINDKLASSETCDHINSERWTWSVDPPFEAECWSNVKLNIVEKSETSQMHFWKLCHSQVQMRRVTLIIEFFPKNIKYLVWVLQRETFAASVA